MSDELRAAILAAADAVDAARSELGVLDGAAGDGDHGMTMSIGARNVRRALQATPPDASAADLVRRVARAMGDIGGAIGPLYSAALTAVAVEIAGGRLGRAQRLGERMERIDHGLVAGQRMPELRDRPFGCVRGAAELPDLVRWSRRY